MAAVIRQYLSEIEGMLKIRLTNFRLTSNDLYNLIYSTYKDIATRVVIDMYRQEVIINSEAEPYDLDMLLDTPSRPLEIFFDCMSIQDTNGMDISDFFEDIGDNVYMKTSSAVTKTTQGFYELKDGDKVFFIRHYIPPFDKISYRTQTIMLRAIIDGCVYHSHDAITNPDDVQKVNLLAQRYYSSVEEIRKKLVQRI